MPSTLSTPRHCGSLPKPTKKQKRASDVEKTLEHFRGMTTLLEMLQHICDELLGEHGPTITQCRNMLKKNKKFINIFDFVDGKYDKVCSSRAELRKRCEKRGFFPLKKAKRSLLKELLQNLLHR